MGKSKGKHRLDKFYHLAKEQGYRSRAAFKLVQINRKYGFLGRSKAVLDLCAAPGGWLQVARKHMPMAGLLVGVDLAPIRPIPGVHTLVEDITTQKCRSSIKRISNGGLFDAVLHDGAPNVGGAWASEANMQSVLVLESLRLATVFLAPNGTFVTKVFRSSDYTALLYAFHQLFHKVEATKPQASRNTSAEIFVVCLGYKAPEKIDPRLLDHRHLFQDYTEGRKVVDVLAPTKQKRNREGYEEGISTTHKATSVVDYVNSESPATLLGEVTQLLFEETRLTSEEKEEPGPSLSEIEQAPETSDEIRELCKDLQVLGKREFKQLLKWRMQIRRRFFAERKMALQAAVGSQEDQLAEEETTEDPEEALMRELTDAKEIAERKVKQKKKRELKAKQKERVRRLLRSTGDMGVEQDEELFDLSSITRKQALDRLEQEPERMEDELEEEEEEEGADPSVSGESGSDHESSDDEAYNASLERALDVLYEQYLEGTNSKSAHRKRRRAKIDEMELDGMGSMEEYREGSRGAIAEPSDDEEQEEINPLLLDMEGSHPKPSADSIASQWFSQDVFKDIDTDSDDEGSDPKQHIQGTVSQDDEEEKSDSELEEGISNGLHLPSTKERVAAAGEEEGIGYEIVPSDTKIASLDSSSESELDDIEDLDEESRAEILAYGKKMLRKKDKENIIDSSYHRYVFHDVDLPSWFAEDERKHMQPQKPITKEEYMEAKAQLRAIDSRAIHKVAEAKARKRKRLVRRMEKAKQRAGGIAEQEDVPASAKAREIKKLYAQAKRSVYGKKDGKKKKGRASDGNSKKPLDRRLLADQRGRGGKGMSTRGPSGNKRKRGKR